MVDVLIIGGGPAGLSCGITLASARSKPWFGDRHIAIVDAGRSDLDRAQLNNAPGIAQGSHGADVRAQLQQQFLDLAQYCGTLIDATICTVQHGDEGWTVTAQDGTQWHAAHLVIATGYKTLNIDGLPSPPKPHHPEGKPGRIRLPHKSYAIHANAHVAGLLAGGASQFAIAAGIGAQVAVEVLCSWAGKRTHIHDVPAP